MPEYIEKCFSLQISCMNISKVLLYKYHAWLYREVLQSINIMLNISRSVTLYKYRAWIYREGLQSTNAMLEYIEKYYTLQISCLNISRSDSLYNYLTWINREELLSTKHHARMYRELLYSTHTMPEYIEKCYTLQISCLNISRSVTIYKYHAWIYR